MLKNIIRRIQIILSALSPLWRWIVGAWGLLGVVDLIESQFISADVVNKIPKMGLELISLWNFLSFQNWIIIFLIILIFSLVEYSCSQKNELEETEVSLKFPDTSLGGFRKFIWQSLEAAKKLVEDKNLDHKKLFDWREKFLYGYELVYGNRGKENFVRRDTDIHSIFIVVRQGKNPTREQIVGVLNEYIERLIEFENQATDEYFKKGFNHKDLERIWPN